MTQRKPLKIRPTPKQIRAATLVSENLGADKPKPIGEILLESGYAPSVAETPAIVTESDGFKLLMDELLPDNSLVQTHKRLLESRKLDHMVFPLGPKDEYDSNLSGSHPGPNQIEKAGIPVERTTLSDQEIKDMLADVNCQVRRIVHGDTARHVYFWAHDASAQQKAVELGYKLKGYLNSGGQGININFNAYASGQRESYNVS